MMKRLDPLLKPRSIAVVGVSEKAGTYGYRAGQNIPNSSIGDHVYFVNPNHEEMFGRKCYKTIADIPECVDCAILCVPRTAVCGCLEQAGQAGVKAAVVYASGFNEEQTDEGRALERDLIAVSERYGLQVAGPNTAGLCNRIDRISLTVGPVKFRDPPPKTGIAIAGQSGFIAGNLNQRLGDCLAYAVGSGNGSVVPLEDYLLYFVEDEHVNSIGVYLEGIKDGAKFERFLSGAALAGKPVVILKSGKSQKGAKAAASHTGNLAGSNAAYESVFRKFGVVSVDTLEEFVSMARLLAVLGKELPKKPAVAGINFSGGENTLCADMCERVGVPFAEYTEETMAEIRKLLPGFATAANPLDATTDMFSDVNKLHRLMELLEQDPNVGLVVLGCEMGETLEAKDRTICSVVRELKQRPEGYGKPILLSPSLEQPRNREAVTELLELGVPLLSTGEIGYRSVAGVCRYVSYHPKEHTLVLAPPVGASGRKTAGLSELESKLRLATVGIPVPGQVLVQKKETLGKQLAELHFPVAMKICSPDILHKTEAGGVILNVQTADEAEKAFDTVMESCRAYAPEARLDGILVQEMAPKGLEMIIGVKNDAQFGQMLLVGMGGIFVEVFRDVALYPCPINRQEAMDMLKSLKAYRLLSGYRGSKPCDVDALAEMMVKVSAYAAEHADSIAEMDLNPVFVYEEGHGCCAVDAMIVEYQE